MSAPPTAAKSTRTPAVRLAVLARARVFPPTLITPALPVVAAFNVPPIVTPAVVAEPSEDRKMPPWVEVSVPATLSTPALVAAGLLPGIVDELAASTMLPDAVTLVGASAMELTVRLLPACSTRFCAGAATRLIVTPFATTRFSVACSVTLPVKVLMVASDTWSFVVSAAA